MWMQIFSSRGMVGAGVGGLCWTVDGGSWGCGGWDELQQEKDNLWGRNAKTQATLVNISQTPG